MTHQHEDTAEPQGYGLDSEWVPGEDGIPFRTAARVVVLDAQGRALLVRGHDSQDEYYTWWFTVGGGLAPGEDPRVGACRELYEETGILAQPSDLEGPVLSRVSLFEFSTITCRQAETFFLLRLSEVDDLLGTRAQDGWTALERRVLDELRWWTADELSAEAARGTLVFPRDLPTYLRDWREPWQTGREVPHIEEERE